MTTCRFCDHRNPPGQKHCTGCGAELPVEAASPRPPDPVGELSELDRELLAILQKSGKIQAIKRCREATGVGLKEAKDAIEALAARSGVQPSPSGCVKVLLAMFATICLMVAAAVAGGARWLW